MKQFLLYILFITTLTANAQNIDPKNDFDSLYYEIAINISVSNPTLALHLADSLYIHTSSDRQKLRALLLSVDILEKQERHEEAMEVILTALQRAEKIQDYNAQAKIYGYLSTQSRIIGILDEGKLYMEKGLAISEKMETPEEIESYQAMARNELAEYEIYEGNYKEALQLLELSLMYYNKVEDPRLRNFMQFQIIEVMARCYMGLKKPKKALELFQKAHDHLTKSETDNPIYHILAYQGLGEMFMINNKLDSAGIYLNKALTLSNEIKHKSLQEIVYGSLSTYYRETNSLDSAVYYSEKYRTTVAENRQKTQRLTNAFYHRMPQDLPQQEPFNWWIIGGGILVTLGGMVLFKKDAVKNIFKNDSPSENGIKISLATKRKLQRRIKIFEDSKKFLSPNMNFSTLVSFLDTNPKYLNHFIKTNYNTDYNTYINNLRINYIVEQLNTKPTYRKYKISHLAKESGFSSHSNFSANFKRVTQLSPSEFIEKVKLEN